MNDLSTEQTLPDLAEQLNIFDDLTDEPEFSITSSNYHDFDSFVQMSKGNNFTNGFTLVSLNIRSLPNKVSHLTNMLAELKTLPSVICLQEIWSCHANLSLEGYHPLE